MLKKTLIPEAKRFILRRNPFPQRARDTFISEEDFHISWKPSFLINLNSSGKPLFLTFILRKQSFLEETFTSQGTLVRNGIRCGACIACVACMARMACVARVARVACMAHISTCGPILWEGGSRKNYLSQRAGTLVGLPSEWAAQSGPQMDIGNAKKH